MAPISPFASRTSTYTPADPNKDILLDVAWVKNPASERNAIDTDAYSDTTKSLTGYIEGSRVNVECFHNVTPGNRKTTTIDATTERSVVHTSYTRIMSFEIILPDGYSFSHTTTTGQSQVEGEAFIYPGLTPSTSDLFLAPIGDNVMGQFRITSVTRMTWRHQSFHRISFMLSTTPNQQEIKALLDCVTTTRVFEKKTFLTAPTALLTQDAYIQRMRLKQLRHAMLDYYFNLFTDRSIGTIFRPDGVYDPFVVRFMSGKAVGDHLKWRPSQLVDQEMPNYVRSLWARLSQPEVKNLRHLFTYSTIDVHLSKASQVSQLALTNKRYLTIQLPPEKEDSTIVPYIFGSAFYTATTDTIQTLSGLEQLIWKIVATRTMTPEAIGDFLVICEDYQGLLEEDAFYFIPLYLFICDVVESVLIGFR